MSKTLDQLFANIASKYSNVKENSNNIETLSCEDKIKTSSYKTYHAVYNSNKDYNSYFYNTIKPKEEIKPTFETFAYKAPEYKYYISASLNGKPYKTCGLDLILRKNLTDGQFAEVYSDKSVKECCKDDTEYYEKMLSSGEFMESPKELTNRILGVVENGYYVPRKHPDGFGRGKSKYCLERSDLGWESVIISGRNPNIVHLAGSNEAKACDEFVKSGEWILAEVAEVIES